MAQQTQKVLEFPQLIKILQRFAASLPGRRCLATLQPSWNFDDVQARLQEVDELAAVDARGRTLSAGGLPGSNGDSKESDGAGKYFAPG